MGRVIEFPGGQRREPEPAAEPVRDIEIALAQTYLETARLQQAQIKADMQRARFLWVMFCARRAAFWGVVLWLLSRFV
jgi:hypothetical protein